MVRVNIAQPEHAKWAIDICKLLEDAAQVKGTGIAKRSPAYIAEKIRQGKAIIAISEDGKVAGFCYIETWEHGKYVANSGLIVHPKFRNLGLAKRIKEAAFKLSRKKYPKAKVFGITTSSAVMKINTYLGYRPVPLSELTTDDEFWKGCESCKNYDILTRTNRTLCLCTGMLFDPMEKVKKYTEESVKQDEKESHISV
ncbi:MAG TPA: GNAT family N-acetyltransferase [Caldithrix sp.]|nr:GNAT family N-acetyltransferase [Calditrichaceae bacterium]MBN2710567.1 GNAT family N-acetyltransferase [Calditrichaceae bacterium]RQV94109.1 MAG: GNAT family N-acetyltransferase [Calditrichota bacterium]HEM48844.1 GNAT family N-acetyltransferase [Caldithrix sp.]